MSSDGNRRGQWNLSPSAAHVTCLQDHHNIRSKNLGPGKVWESLVLGTHQYFYTHIDNGRGYVCVAVLAYAYT